MLGDEVTLNGIAERERDTSRRGCRLPATVQEVTDRLRTTARGLRQELRIPAAQMHVFPNAARVVTDFVGLHRQDEITPKAETVSSRFV